MMSFENPFTKGFDAWTKIAEESWTRTAAFFTEIEKLEGKGVERADSAIGEWAKMTRESLAYGVQLRSEFRKLALQSMQQANSAFTKAATVATNNVAAATSTTAQPS